MTNVGIITVGLGIAVGGHRITGWLDDRFRVLPECSDGTLRSDVRKWLVAGALVGYVLLVEGRPLTSLGATLPRTVPVAGGIEGVAGLVVWWVAGVVGTTLLTFVVLAVYRRTGLTVPREFGAEQAARGPLRYGFTALTAGVTESLLFQAYIIERITLVSGSVLLAAASSWLLFTGAHYLGETFSLEETLYIGTPALAVTGLYVLSGSLYAIVLVHATVVLLSFLSE